MTSTGRLRRASPPPSEPTASRASHLLAAIVVTHESESHVARTLPRLQEELRSGSPIVVWDNASSDGTVDTARRSAPGAQVIAFAENLGFAAAVNQAAALVEGCDLLLVNPDVVAGPGSVAILESALNADPNLAVVTAHVMEGGSVVRAAWAYPTAGRAAAGALIGLSRAYRVSYTTTAAAELVMRGFVPFTFALLRRQVFDQLGGLDERFWLYAEDADYCYRAQAAGWRIGVCTDAWVEHSGRGSSRSREAALARQLRSEDCFRRLHSGRVGERLAAGTMLAGAAARLAFGGAWVKANRWQWQVVARHYLGWSVAD